MRWASWTIGAILLWLSAAQAVAAAAPSFPERGRRAVVDAARVIPDGPEAALEARLLDFNRVTGHQFVVATVPSLQGLEPQDYGVRLLRHWRLGRAGVDDGILLLLAPNDRQVRIETGYGFEPVLTDALADAIFRETIRPALRRGDIAGALGAGADRIMEVASSADRGAFRAPTGERGISWGWIAFGLVGGGLLLLFLYPLFEAWFDLWPFYVLMPARAARARERCDAKLAEWQRQREQMFAAAAGSAKPAHGRNNDLSTVGEMAEAMREKQRRLRPPEPRKPRRSRSRGWGFFGGGSDGSSYGGGGGFSGGGGSGGGGGAGGSY